MLLSLAWLREFVPFEGTAEQLGDRLTMLGLELEEIRRPFDAIRAIVVGHVVERAKHPEADKLSVCKVDAGQGELLDIVCGAPNVAAGQKVPVALVGTTMPDGMVIKKAKLRGQPSHGMICSERELGLSDDHEGIMVLPEHFTVGRLLVDELQLDMEVCDISITPNRADCLSVLGLAREVALGFGLPLTLPRLNLVEDGPDCSGEVAIEIPDPALCPVYQGRILENVRVGKSPARIRHRLTAIGVRPISNIVDASNYVMMELGQPLHAFDLDLLEGRRIVVSPAVAGERIVTLDGQDRVLTPGDLLIRDGVKPVALAGVMGGANTEVSDATTRVLLESAVFRPGTIRRTSRRLGLSSEAAYRMERGLDQPGSLFALHRAVQMMAELSGARLRPGVCSAEPRPWTSPALRFRPARARMLLGMGEDTIGDGFCADTLTSLGCVLDKSDAADWKVSAPSHRLDFEREADLIEEVGRVYGLDAIPPVLPKVMRPLDQAGAPESEYDFWRRIKGWGRGLGLNEAINYSFVGQKDLDHLGLPAEGRIPIMNPLSEDQNVLRTALAPGLLNNLRHNIAQGNAGLRLFELARIFTADETSETTACERGRMGVLMYGARHDDAWPNPEADADYQDLKGVVEHFAAFLHLPAPRCEMAEGAHPFLAPCVAVTVAGRRLGVMGRVKPDLADAYHARKDVWLADIDLDAARQLHDAVAVRFAALPVYPPVRRDITVIAPASLQAGAVLDHVRAMKLPLLEGVELIDVFAPEDREERNLTFRMTFRHAGRTLKDAEVDKEREKVASSVVQALSVRI